MVHSSPDQFALDKNLLPTAKTKFGKFLVRVAYALGLGRVLSQVYSMETFIKDKLTKDERKEALTDLHNRRETIFERLDNIKKTD